MGLLDEMESLLPKDEMSSGPYWSAITLCRSAKKWRPAVQILERMKSHGVMMTLEFAMEAIITCMESRRPLAALRVKAIMDEVGLEGDRNIKRSLMQATQKAKDRLATEFQGRTVGLPGSQQYERLTIAEARRRHEATARYEEQPLLTSSAHPPSLPTPEPGAPTSAGLEHSNSTSVHPDRSESREEAAAVARAFNDFDDSWSREVYVQNLPHSIQIQDVYDHFGKVGSIQDVNLPFHMPRHAYVRFFDPARVADAVKLDGGVLQGRALRVRANKGRSSPGRNFRPPPAPLPPPTSPLAQDSLDHPSPPQLTGDTHTMDTTANTLPQHQEAYQTPVSLRSRLSPSTSVSSLRDKLRSTEAAAASVSEAQPEAPPRTEEQTYSRHNLSHIAYSSPPSKTNHTNRPTRTTAIFHPPAAEACVDQQPSAAPSHDLPKSRQPTPWVKLKDLDWSIETLKRRNTEYWNIIQRNQPTTGVDCSKEDLLKFKRDLRRVRLFRVLEEITDFDNSSETDRVNLKEVLSLIKEHTNFDNISDPSPLNTDKQGDKFTMDTLWKGYRMLTKLKPSNVKHRVKMDSRYNVVGLRLHVHYSSI